MKKTILSLIALFILFCGTTVMADTEVIIDFSGKEEVKPKEALSAYDIDYSLNYLRVRISLAVFAFNAVVHCV